MYEEYRERVLREKLEKARESRIRATKKLPKVNKELASRLLEAKTKKSDGVTVRTIAMDWSFTKTLALAHYPSLLTPLL